MPLRFGPLADFSTDTGANSLEFVEEIRGMSEPRKADERFRLPEMMALTGWFQSFRSNPEDVIQVEKVPREASSP